MGFIAFPLTAGSDINSLSVLSELWYAIRERHWATGCTHWPRTNFIWGYGTITSIVRDGSNKILITDTAATWSTNQFNYPAGAEPFAPNQYDVMVDFFDDPYSCKRFRINENTTTVLTCADDGQDLASCVGKKIYIIKRNGLWWSDRWPDENGWLCYWWYRGATDLYWSHYPNGTLTGARLGADTVVWPDIQSHVYCTDEPHPIGLSAMDRDMWSTFDGFCSPYDKCFSPNLFKTIRGIQADLEGLCTSFVDKDTDFDGMTAIEPFTAASWFKKSDIGISYTRTISSFSSDIIYFSSCSFPYLPIDIYWEVKNTSGVVVDNGTTTAVNNNSLTMGNSDWIGYTLTISLGWLRKSPKEFRYYYDKTCFLPQSEDDLFPTEDNPGSWNTRGKSTTYLDKTNIGKVIEGSVAFIVGQDSRYVGDNVADTTLDYKTDTSPWSLAYDDYFYTQTRTSDERLSMTGIASSGSSWYLRDTSKNWWDGTLATWSGTASSGTSYTLTDSSKAAVPLWDGSGGRWSGHIFEITSGADNGKRIPCLQQNSHTTVEFPSWCGATSISNGITYRIKEPTVELNKWKDRQVKIIKANGDEYTVTIKYSDWDTLYFEPVDGLTIEEDDQYSIIEAEVGYVYRRTRLGWTIVDSNNNSAIPSITTKYGRMAAGDYITVELLSQIYRGIVELQKYYMLAGWTGRANDSTPEINEKIVPGFMGPCNVEDGTGAQATLCADGKASADENWDGGEYGLTTESNTAPFSISNIQMLCNLPADGRVTIGRHYAYCQLDPPDCFDGGSRSVDFYVYSTITEADPDDGVTLGGACCDGSYNVVTTFYFTDTGDPVKYRQWSLIGSASGTGEFRVQLGSDAKPTWVNCPPAIPQCDTPFDAGSQCLGSSMYEGYVVTKQVGIVSYNFNYV